MKPFLILPVLLFLSMVCAAQQRDIRVVGDYEELADTEPHDTEEVWARMDAPVRVASVLLHGGANVFTLRLFCGLTAGWTMSGWMSAI